MSFIVSNTYDIHATASLDLQFSNKKSLVDQISGRNLVDHTRASSGTYVGSDGLIKTAVTNLLLQSEDFSTTWTTNRASIIPNAAIAPNGTLTADKLVDDNLSVGVGYVNQSVTALGSVSYAFSFYAKAAEVTSIRGYFVDSSGVISSSIFDLLTGVSTGSNASMQSVGNGWYRCIIVDQPLAGSLVCRILFETDTATLNGIYIWGAQLEQSDTVGEYVKTTSTINSAPRFDHDPTTGESLGLLVEESRTNLLLQSEDFSTTWNQTGVTVTANSVAAPTGATTADKLIESSGGTTHLTAQTITVANATVYTLSVFAKAAERSRVALYFGGAGGAAQGIIVNLATGAFAANIVAAPTSYSIVPFPNGWYRISITATSSGTAANFAIYICDNTNAFSYSGDGTSGIYIWGAQLEEGSFPTSYIPTEGSTVTRAADVASITGSNFSSWYRQDEGTFFANVLYKDKVTNNRLFFTESDANGFNDRHGLVGGSNSTGSLGPYGETFIAGSSQASLNQGGPSPNTRYLAAYAYKQDNFGFSRNGATAVTDTSGNLPTNQSYAWIGQSLNANWMNSPIARLTFWPARLPNETLQTITQ